MRSIQRQLRMGASTVVRYAHAATREELLRRPCQEHSSRVDPFKPYLDQRWDQEGCTNAWKLFEEIKELGYPGGYSMVRAYLYPKRIRAQPAEPRPPRVRKVAGWIMTPPDALSEEDRLPPQGTVRGVPGAGDAGRTRALLRTDAHPTGRAPPGGMAQRGAWIGAACAAGVH
ncbi:hypothetical protein Nans01_30060 [Nocardiopsis ansamitocini]|uniref:Uncharacterized protein n=1 Tax=Nocardiopsis ansamitocini TaxID=1670832 RepID=A0A9W6P713_9ACTN|nr:hypothetical protein Nans01_30060 [Nocardiopsis ansamitocini]